MQEMPLKMTVFWNVTTCNLVKTDQPLRGIYCLALMMEDVSTFEISVCFYKTT